jgi:hypothetical protein
MLSFAKLNNRNCGKMLTVTSVQNCDDRKSGNNSAINQRRMREQNPGTSFTVICRMFALILALAIAPTLVSAEEEEDPGGHVLPATARPHGYSLERMASLLAFFDSTGNHLVFYPFPQFPDRSDPFQILYLDSGLNPLNFHFKVYARTIFFVPLTSIDDSPPIIGKFPPYPPETGRAADYFLNRQQLGGHDWVIFVDDSPTPLGAEFFVGPVLTPPLADAPPCQGGTHLLQFGVFLTPLSMGRHTIRFKGTLDGAALLLANNGNPFTEDITYTVEVVPSRGEE